MPEFVSFGEVMLRLSPPGRQRLTQSTSLEASFGGGEANVAVGLAQLGIGSRFVSAVPDNEIGQACINSLRGWGVDTSCVARSGHRLGIYFLEHGASQRPSKVIYDRAGSSISVADPGSFDWDAIFADAKWFHFTGITPALSASAAKSVREAAAAARRLGVRVSCDLNYRSKLWSREQARMIMTDLMGSVDVLVANEEDCEAVFGVSAGTSNVAVGQIDHVRYADVATELADRFSLEAVAITLRESFSASRNGWSGMLYEGGKAAFSRRYEIDVVDRVGSGDAFAAGLIYSLLKKMDSQSAVEFAAAAGCLKHSVPGDFPNFSVAEIEALVGGDGSGRVQR